MWHDKQYVELSVPHFWQAEVHIARETFSVIQFDFGLRLLDDTILLAYVQSDVTKYINQV